VSDTIDATRNLRRFLTSYHSIKRFFFNLDAILRRATRAQHNCQRKLQAEREEFSKLIDNEQQFVCIRKNRDKALFGAVDDPRNDSVGLYMRGQAYLSHDISNVTTCDPPEGKKEPEQLLFWNDERQVKYSMSNTPSLLAEEVYELKRYFKYLLGWLLGQ
jgi:hypothetical protein